jgi:uncharacterized membrane protein
MEAFSDGVIAIVITIMVLELHIPDEPTFQALGASATGLLTYLLSYLYVGIYWNNHHHFFHLVQSVGGAVLWANLGLLFTLSLLPFTTSWMDETRFGGPPTMVYGINLLTCATAWHLLQVAVFRAEGQRSLARRAVGKDVKGKASPLLYLLGIAAATFEPWAAITLYSVVAFLWLVPDRRFASAVSASSG